MAAGTEHTYTAVTIEGGLLPADLITAIIAGDRDVPGIRAEDYHLASGERLGEAATRRWDYLRGAYQGFRDRLANLPATDPATTLTRERWVLVLLNELGYGRIPFVRGGITVDGRPPFGVSHLWQHVPIHIISWHTRLEARTGGGEAGRPAQSMVQDLLNSSDDHLWAILSNGRQLRLLRDSTTMAASAYIEFDLEAIFDGELYSDFVLLYALLHVSRLELLDRADGEAPTPAECRLEQWRAYAAETGTRARDQLRNGVKAALEQLGTGFLEANPALRDRLRDGQLTDREFHHELLRLAYQLVFLLVAEERGALLDPDASSEAKQRYLNYFSATRLRRIAERRQGDRHTDLWQTLVMVLDGLGDDAGLPDLGLPALGGLFFRAGVPNGDDVHPDLLRDCALTNERMLAAIRPLIEIRDRRGRRRRVNYRHLDSEELGGIYESLLELDPDPDIKVPRFTLNEEVRGNDRKETGSYYTPTPLIEALLDTALDPVIDQHAASGSPDDLLRLTVCDPACGSGHFLVAAARRIAKRYATLTIGDEPSPTQIQAAMAKVVRHCIYGVDINPLAVELAKISLWLESLEPGKPLAFLDAHIKVGNALLGTTPALLREGIPDDAYKALDGDDPAILTLARKDNKAARERGLHTLFDLGDAIAADNTVLAQQTRDIATAPIKALADVREQARRFRDLENSPDRRRQIQAANAWCAAFIWPNTTDGPTPITTQTVRGIDEGDALPPDVSATIDHLASTHNFFHWHLEFPDVFSVSSHEMSHLDPDTGWRGGFACIVGNPPWEKVELKHEEYFAADRPDIANARTAAIRQRLIDALESSEEPFDQKLFEDYKKEVRFVAGQSLFMRSSGRYRLTGQGRLNTYAVFAETGRTVIRPYGRCGMVLPTGIATDVTTAPFFGDLVRTSTLAAFLEFENEEFLLSTAVHHSFRFCLLTICGRDATVPLASFAFGSRKMADVEPRTLVLPPADILLLNPNTGTAPLFRSRRDAEITMGIYRRVPILWQESPEANPWSLSFLQDLFNMATHSGLFRTRERLEEEGWHLDGAIFKRDNDRMLPLYEAKMVHHFDHRFGTYEGQTQAQANMGTLPRLTLNQKADPNAFVLPRYWVAARAVEERLGNRWGKGWLLGWRDICRSTDDRTMIYSFLPRVAVGHTMPIVISGNQSIHLLAASLSSFASDYLVRQKMSGTHLTYSILCQLAVHGPEEFQKPAPWARDRSSAEWVTQRVIELAYTAWDMQPFARDLGDNGPPFVWNEDRRFAMRAELDAAYFHLYGVEGDDVDYIMDTFQAFRNNDPERFIRTKATILEVYDAMADAMTTGVPYRSLLDPPPGEGPRHEDVRR